jgi:hypothetical protein
MVFAIGRRLWPGRPGLAIAAAVLLATSSQLLIASMTSYAMTAHMAFDLVWLWLFLRGDRLGHAGAALVGFLACGLHQLVFHPLFVAPFVLELILARRWRSALFYTGAYAAICLFWINYDALALHLAGADTGGAALKVASGASRFAGQAAALVSDFKPAGVGMMGENLIRFVTWQNPLTAPLALIGMAAVVKAPGTLRALALGLVLTIVACFIILAYQGHGWGFRYVHGLLGSACLLAVAGWERLTRALPPEKRAPAAGAFAAIAAIAALVLFPVRALQAHGFEHPYAAAYAAIERDPAQVVLLDDTGRWFTADLVRNEPYLGNRPVVLRLTSLSADDLDDLCARYTVSLFTAADAGRFGIRAFRDPDSALAARLAAPLRGRSCGRPMRPVGEVRG